MIRHAALIAAVGALAGCYHYTPMDTGSVAQGMEVRARVNAQAAERIAPLFGGEPTRVVAGTVVERSANAFIVEVPTVVQAGVAGAVQTLHQRISLAPTDVTEMDRRTLDRQKTGMLVGGAAVAVIYAAVKGFKGNPGIDHPSNPSPLENRIPIVRLHF